jgi:hypothetical protein
MSTVRGLLAVISTVAPVLFASRQSLSTWRVRNQKVRIGDAPAIKVIATASISYLYPVLLGPAAVELVAFCGLSSLCGIVPSLWDHSV